MNNMFNQIQNSQLRYGLNFQSFFLSVWPRLREWAEDFAGGDGRQSLAVGLFTGWLVFSRG